MSIRCHWFHREPKGNFGDEFTDYLFREYFGVELQRTNPRNADLFSTGSIIEMIPQSFKGTILGSGMMVESSRRDFAKTSVPLLRGHRTRERCILAQESLLGDPGILAYLFAEPTETKYRNGIIPHYVDEQSPALAPWRNDPDTLIMDIGCGVQELIDQASQCERIVSSSLHGLVLADSLGIPCAWVELSNLVYGDGFKFRDYYSVYNEEPTRFHDISKALNNCQTRDTRQVKSDVLLSVANYVEAALCQSK